MKPVLNLKRVKIPTRQKIPKCLICFQKIKVGKQRNIFYGAKASNPGNVY